MQIIWKEGPIKEKKTHEKFKQMKLIFAFEFCFLSTASEIQNKDMPEVIVLVSMTNLFKEFKYHIKE